MWLTTTSTTNAAGVTGTWVFNGWTTENATVVGNNFTMPGHDVHFIGTWTFTAATVSEVTVTFHRNFNVASVIHATRTFAPGNSITSAPNVTMPTNPTRTGYNFMGWFTVPAATGGVQFTATTPVHQDITVFARWEAIPAGHVTVTFQPGTQGSLVNGTPNVVITVPVGTILTEANVPGVNANTGWTHSGWRRNGVVTIPIGFQVNENVTFIAQYATVSPVNVTVTFHRNFNVASVVHATRTFAPGNSITSAPNVTMPGNPIRAGYTFMGWFTVPAATGGTPFTANTTVNTDITVYARWVPVCDDGKCDGPKTGDDSSIFTWISLSILSSAGMLTIAVNKKSLKHRGSAN